jgi:hypothetical protein
MAALDRAMANARPLPPLHDACIAGWSPDHSYQKFVVLPS